MKCRKCGSEIRDGQRFCSGCGQKISRFCTVCGSELQMGEKFCSNCGSPMGKKVVEDNVSVAEMQSEETARNYTDEEFLAKINDLATKDVLTKAAIKFYGTKVMQKELLPILKPGEEVLLIANIYKISIDKYAKEFFVLTSDRALEIVKGGGLPGVLLPVKVKECSIGQITSIEAKKTVVGSTLTIKTATSIFKTQLVAKEGADLIKQKIEAQNHNGGMKDEM